MGMYSVGSSYFSGFEDMVLKTILQIILVLAIVIALYIFVLPDKKRPELNGFFRFIHDYLKIRKLMIESIARFIYVCAVVICIVNGFFLLFDEFVIGLGLMVLGPILWRLIYELAYLLIIAVKSLMEINAQLKEMRYSATGNAGKTAEEEKPAKKKERVCENCGQPLEKGAMFCIHCGRKYER